MCAGCQHFANIFTVRTLVRKTRTANPTAFGCESVYGDRVFGTDSHGTLVVSSCIIHNILYSLSESITHKSFVSTVQED